MGAVGGWGASWGPRGRGTWWGGVPRAPQIARKLDGAVAGYHLSGRPTTEESPVQETNKIWMNGELVDWADATVHVGTHGLHYGSGVFEGIRCYETVRGPAVFRLAEHMERLHRSAKLLYMELPYSVDELRAATWELIGASERPPSSPRPTAVSGYWQLGAPAADSTLD